MYRDKRIAVNISAFNEEKLICDTLRSIPKWVDFIVVVDDHSSDLTAERMGWHRTLDHRVRLVTMIKNGGFGAVTVRGYEVIQTQHIDIIANLNGDGQMDVTALQSMIDKLLDTNCDLVKGDRLTHREARRMPAVRRLGGHLLSRLTSWTTGYHISDSQHTYHVIKMDALKKLRLNRLYPRFGYPNDFLIECAKQGLKVANHTTRPIYDNGQVSVMKIWKVWPRILYILARGYIQIRAARLVIKLDTHPNENPAY